MGKTDVYIVLLGKKKKKKKRKYSYTVWAIIQSNV